MRACGLCGIHSKMTKAHVPPQCVGNDHLVGRSYMRTHNSKARMGRAVEGGLYVYGLCESCNNLGSRYEDAYKELTEILRPLRKKGLGIDYAATQINLPASSFDPGSTARAIIIGAFGIAPTLRDRYPDLAAEIVDQQDILTVPSELRLRLGLARGTAARIGGMTSGFFGWGPWSHRDPDGTPESVMPFAEVFFPPLAWMVTDDRQPLLDRMGWGDGTKWLRARPGERENLRSTVPTLPYVSHPSHNELLRNRWIELHAGAEAGITEIVECTQLPDSI